MAIHSCSSSTKTVSRTKKVASLARANGEHAHGQCHPSSYVGGTSQPQEVRDPSLVQVAEASHAGAFLRDSDIVVEARLLFFSKHSYNFIEDGNCNLSGIFKKLAVSASLLGTNIHEIQASWTGPEELKQANYTLQSLP